MEECTNQGCPGEYEERAILHLERWNGQPVAIDHVPAEDCTVFGDVLFTGATVAQLATLRQATPEPTGAIPLYEYEVSVLCRAMAAAGNTNR